MSSGALEATAWRNGPANTATAYGLKISAKARDEHFRREWKTVTLILPGGAEAIVVNVNKPSFWNDTCRELISADLRRWMIARGLAPWPHGKPPRFILSEERPGVFRVALAGSISNARR